MDVRGRLLRCGLQLMRRRFLSSSSTAHIVRSPLPDVQLPTVSIPDYVWDKVDRWSDKVAYECAVTGRSYRYAETRELSRRFAASLHRIGLRPGDFLAIVMPNSIEWPIVLLGAIEAGLVVTTVNSVYTAEEISRQLKDCQPRAIVTVSLLNPTVQKAVAMSDMKINPALIIAPGTEKDLGMPSGSIDLMHMIQDGIDTCDVRFSGSANDTALLLYSSGTTGLPKGVMLNHMSILANAAIWNETEEICYHKMASGSYQDVVPAVLPFNHIYAIFVQLIMLASCGAKLVVFPRFEPASFINVLERQRVTILNTVPPLLMFLTSHPGVKSKYLDSVHSVFCTAAPIGETDAIRFMEKAPSSTQFVQAYGMTEASPLVTVTAKGNPNYNSVGVVIPNTEMKIAELDTGRGLAAREEGEVCVRGPQIMQGYFKRPEATAQMIDGEGWLHTGDVGYYDEAGRLYIVDRLKELIKVQGLQVAPAELEEILRSHPAVEDAAVTGVPHERKGEVPRAFVVTSTSNITQEEIKQFVERKVSKHKRLEGGVQFVSSIPVSPSGKILRRELKAMI